MGGDYLDQCRAEGPLYRQGLSCMRLLAVTRGVQRIASRKGDAFVCLPNPENRSEPSIWCFSRRHQYINEVKTERSAIPVLLTYYTSPCTTAIFLVSRLRSLVDRPRCLSWLLTTAYLHIEGNWRLSRACSGGTASEIKQQVRHSLRCNGAWSSLWPDGWRLLQHINLWRGKYCRFRQPMACSARGIRVLREIDVSR